MFTVPAVGGSYTYYPLVRLLPTAQSYSTDTLEKVEGQTSSFIWINWDGSTQNDSWTNYTYFSSTSGTSAYQPLAGDISLPTVIMQQVVRIDPSQNLFDSIYAPMYFSSDGTVPAYFTNNDQSTVDDIQQHLNSIEQNDLPALNYNDYKSKLVDISGLTQYGLLK